MSIDGCMESCCITHNGRLCGGLGIWSLSRVKRGLCRFCPDKFHSTFFSFAGNVGFLNVKKMVKLTDTCVSARHVADMSANMMVTQPKTVSAKVLTMSRRHVTYRLLATCRWETCLPRSYSCTSSSSVRHYAITPVHQYTIMPLHHYAITPVRQYVSTPVHHYAITPLRQYVSMPVRQYASTPVDVRQ